MRRITTVALAFLPVFVFYSGLAAKATEIKEQPPATQAPQGPSPSVTVKELAKRQPPALIGKGEEAKKSALAFIDWASASTKDQDDLVRKSIATARENPDIVQAICEEAFAQQESDHSRALVALSLAGEAKSPHSLECLAKFVRQPLPEKGTVVEGEILEKTALASLQAKAIDGLAYLRNENADRYVLEAAAKHPSRIVRAEAIAAYLWNHDYSDKARESLKSVIRKDEVIFMDRLVKQAGEPRDSFNRKLAEYLKAHPEVQPSQPDKAESKRKPTVGQPPKF